MLFPASPLSTVLPATGTLAAAFSLTSLLHSPLLITQRAVAFTRLPSSSVMFLLRKPFRPDDGNNGGGEGGTRGRTFR